MKKQDLDKPSYQPKLILQRGGFSQLTQKHSQYSAKQIDQLQQDLQKQSNLSIRSPKSNEISISYHKVKKYDNEPSSPLKKSTPNQKPENENQIKSNTSLSSPSKRVQPNNYHNNSNNKIQFQLSAISKDVDQQNTFNSFTNPLENDETQQQIIQEKYYLNQLASLNEFQFQCEELDAKSYEKSQVLEDLREQIQIEQTKLQELEEDYLNLKIKNEIAIKGDEKQNDVLLKKLQILQQKVQQKEETEQEEVELRLKINDEFEYINEQIRFLEAENQLEIESINEELQQEKLKQAQLIKQLEFINKEIESNRENQDKEEDLQIQIEQKSDQIRELGERKQQIVRNAKEVQDVYQKIEQQYQMQIEIAEGEFELEQNEYNITITEQNLLLNQLIRDIKIMSEFITNPFDGVKLNTSTLKQLTPKALKSEIVIEEDYRLRSSNQNSPVLNNIQNEEFVQPIYQISQESQSKIKSAIEQRVEMIDKEVQKIQQQLIDSTKKKEFLLQQIAEIQIKSKEQQNDYDDESQKFQNKIQKLENEMRNNQARAIQIENELKELDSKVQGNREILETYSTNIENSNAQIKQFQERITDYQNQIKLLQEQKDKTSLKKKKK